MEMLRYYDFAEDDYEAIKILVNADVVKNVICYKSQNICEKYLKQIIVNYIQETDDNMINYTGNLKTHNIARLINFIKENLSDFSIPACVRDVDGYYFSTNYPGDNSFKVTKEDVDRCWNAVETCKSFVDAYINSHPDKIDEFRSE